MEFDAMERIRLNTVYGMYAQSTAIPVSERDIIRAIEMVNSATELMRSHLSEKFAEERGFDPNDKTIPASMFIGYMDYVYRGMKKQRGYINRIQKLMREQGFDVKQDMQTNLLSLYK